MKITILLLACLVCTAFAWPNKRRGPGPGSGSKDILGKAEKTEGLLGKVEKTEGKDPCREMASKCRLPPVQEENALRQVLREAQNLDAEIKCLDFLGEKIEEKMRKRSEPADEEKVLEEAVEIVKECSCDGPADGERKDGEQRPLSERLFRLLRGEKLEEGREEKCRKAMEEAGIEGPEQGVEGQGQGVEGQGQGVEGPEQGVEGPEQGGDGPEQGVEGPEQGAGGPEQGVEGPEQGAGGPEQGVEGPEQGAEGPEQGVEGPTQGGESTGPELRELLKLLQHLRK